MTMGSHGRSACVVTIASMAANLLDELKARMLLQQCLSAKLQVQPASESREPEFVEIGRGLLVYVCFMKGASEDTVEKMVKAALTVRLSEDDAQKMVSILDVSGDVLIIPQATLGGHMKGKTMQYHKNINKDDGNKLYAHFVQLCQISMQQNDRYKEAGRTVKVGTYGNRQVLSTVTNGPYTHILEF